MHAGEIPYQFGEALVVSTENQQRTPVIAYVYIACTTKIYRVVAVPGYDVALAPRSHQERVVLDDLHANAIQALN